MGISFFIRISQSKIGPTKKSIGTKHDATAKQSATIRLRLRDGKDVNLYAATPLKIPVEYWNEKATRTREKIRNRSEFVERDWYKDQLERLEKHISDNYQRLKWKPSGEWLAVTIKEYFHPEEPEQKRKVTLFEFIKNYIETSKTRINPATGKYISSSTHKKYGTCFNLLKEFAGKRNLDFEDITLEFYESFTRFLTKDKNHATNTVGKQIAILKGFLNDATEKKLNQNTDYKSHKFKIVTEESESIYLNEVELQTIHEHDFSDNQKLERVRDLFLIGAWTGCRFGDFTSIKPDNIKDGFIHVEQEKTGTPVLIPLHPIVEDILNRYDGKWPKSISNQKFNDYIKDVAKAAELNELVTIRKTKGGKRISNTLKKCQLISSHTARRSFATNLYKSGFSTVSIMKITGHKTEKSFLKYIKVTPQEHAEMLADHWATYYNKKELISQVQK